MSGTRSAGRWALACCIALSAWSGSAWAPERLPGAPGARVELPLLREAACRWETRGEAQPSEAIGPGQELGRCQIKPGSAREALQATGHEPPLAVLLVRLVVQPEPIADAVLTECVRRRGTAAGAVRLADCYHRGPRATGQPVGRDREYARQIGADYAALWLARH